MKKHIPGTINFTIDCKGKVYDSKGNLKNTYKNGDGYITVSIKRVDGCWVTYGVHRLLALAFIKRVNPEETEVNHRDGVLINNTKSNLEWVTPTQNNIHSEITRKENQYPALYTEKNGIASGLYRNIHEAAKCLKVHYLSIWDAMKNGQEIEGVRFYHRGFAGRIPLRLQKPKGGIHKSRGVKTLNIDTGDIVKFGSVSDAAKHFGTYTSHISQQIPRNTYPRVFRKQYQLAYTDQEFPQMTREELNRAKNHGPRKVIAYSFDTKEYYTSPCAKEFIEFSGLSKKAVTRSLSKGVLRRIENWVVTYYLPEGSKKLAEFIAGSAAINS